MRILDLLPSTVLVACHEHQDHIYQEQNINDTIKHLKFEPVSELGPERQVYGYDKAILNGQYKNDFIPSVLGNRLK